MGILGDSDMAVLLELLVEAAKVRQKPEYKGIWYPENREHPELWKAIQDMKETCRILRSEHGVKNSDLYDIFYGKPLEKAYLLLKRMEKDER